MAGNTDTQFYTALLKAVDIVKLGHTHTLVIIEAINEEEALGIAMKQCKIVYEGDQYRGHWVMVNSLGSNIFLRHSRNEITVKLTIRS